MDLVYKELQIHSPSSRRSVRYVKLTPWRIRTAGAVLVLWVLGVVFALAVSPRVVGGVLGFREYASLQTERATLGTRLRGLVDELSRVATDAEAARRTLVKLHLAYGLRVPRKAGVPQAPSPPGAPTVVSPAATGAIYADTEEYGRSLLDKTGQELTALAGLFDAVETFEAGHRGDIASVPASCPLRGPDFVLISPFSIRRSPFTQEMEFHAGIDLAATVGTPVRAPAEGVVAYAGRFPISSEVTWWRFGTVVMVRHPAGFVTIYGHLDEARVTLGQRVHRGDVLGTVGNSGWSASPHLHYEVRIPGASGWRPIDPRLFILDHHWDDEEEVLAKGRHGPAVGTFEALPPSVR